MIDVASVRFLVVTVADWLDHEQHEVVGHLVEENRSLRDDSDWTERARTVLEQTDAEDISFTGETKGDVQNADKPMLRAGVM